MTTSFMIHVSPIIRRLPLALSLQHCTRSTQCFRPSSSSSAAQHKKAAAALKYKSGSTSETLIEKQQQRQDEEESTNQTTTANNVLDKNITDIGEHGIQEKHEKPAERPLKQHSYRLHEFAPRIVVVGIGGGGCNALNNMISSNQLIGVEFLALNTDAQHLSVSLAENRVQLGSTGSDTAILGGLGCGANPNAGRAAAEESRDAIADALDLDNTNMVFLTAGMGGGTGTGAAPVVAELCFHAGILTVAVVTKPFFFEGRLRMRLAEEGLQNLKPVVDSLLVVPNQNLFQVANESTTFIDSFKLADDVLLAGVKGITDLMVSPGLINLDFADVQSVMHGMGNAILGTGQAEGEGRAIRAAELALQNPLVHGELDISTAKGLLVNITGGADMTLYEVDQAAQRITQIIKDENANIIFGSAFDVSLSGSIKVSIVATGLDDSSTTATATSTYFNNSM